MAYVILDVDMFRGLLPLIGYNSMTITLFCCCQMYNTSQLGTLTIYLKGWVQQVFERDQFWIQHKGVRVENFVFVTV